MSAEESDLHVLVYGVFKVRPGSDVARTAKVLTDVAKICGLDVVEDEWIPDRDTVADAHGLDFDDLALVCMNPALLDPEPSHE